MTMIVNKVCNVLFPRVSCVKIRCIFHQSILKHIQCFDLFWYFCVSFVSYCTCVDSPLCKVTCIQYRLLICMDVDEHRIPRGFYCRWHIVVGIVIRWKPSNSLGQTMNEFPDLQCIVLFKPKIWNWSWVTPITCIHFLWNWILQPENTWVYISVNTLFLRS